MDSKKKFFETIMSYYSELAEDVPTESLNKVTIALTDYYFDQYGRFAKQYPKSIKRYSSFKTSDLDHPDTFEIIIRTLKETEGPHYEKSAMTLLKLDFLELKAFEKNREDFYKIF